MPNKLTTGLLPLLFPFLRWGKDINKRSLKSDLAAGVTGAIIVLPQGLTFAMIAGLPPIYGLYTAMITPIVAALFGSSKHLVSGPNTPISLLIFSVVSQMAAVGSDSYIQLALTITFLAGIFQLALGIGRMGTLSNFVSQVVLTGFTAGAAILIIESQLKNLLGITLPKADSFLHSLADLSGHLASTNLYALGTGLFTLAIAIIIKKWLPRWPNMIIALVAGSILAQILIAKGGVIQLIGPVKGSLPPPSLPDFQFANLALLAPKAFAVAILGLIQSIGIARSIAIKSNQQIDPNQEFIGQGLSNIVGSFFSSYAGAGSFTRSGLNYESGAKTPLAVIFASLLLMVIVLLIAPLIAYLPMPAMAAVIVLVGYSLIDFRFSRTVLKASKRQSTVLLITFFSTLFLDLEYAVYIGVLFSLVFYLQRTSQPNVAVMAPDPAEPNRTFTYVARKQLPECPQLKVVRIDGSIFFGSIHHIAAEIRQLEEEDDFKYLLVVATGINFIDVPGSEWLVQEFKYWNEKGGGLYFSGLKLNAQDILLKGGFKAAIGEAHFYTSKEEAVADIFQKLDPAICQSCTKRIFLECGGV
jgi:SulP family sulfate permease